MSAPAAAAAAPSDRGRVWSWLLLLSPVLATLPLAAYAVAVLLGVQGERAADLRADLARAAGSLGAVVEGEVAAGTRALAALAASPRLDQGVLSGFRDEASRVLALNPAWYTIALVEADRQVINLRHPQGAPLPPAAELPAAEVLGTGRNAVTILPGGQAAILAPVWVGGVVRYALVATMPGHALGALLERVPLPQGWSALLLDVEEGRVLARIGGDALTEAALRPALAAPGRPADLADDLVGLTRPVAGTRWQVALAAPAGEFVSDARRWLFAALGISALIAAAGIAIRLMLRQQRDQAERRALETVERTEREAQERRRTDLLATVSHELRTPLTGLLGYTELLSRAALPPVAAEWVQQQRRAGQSLLALIGDVLDFARLEEGQIQLEETDIDLPALFEECAGILRGLAQQKGLALEIRTDPGLPRWVRGDPMRLRQVVTNLLGNAIKFTRLGGVTLSARLTPRGDTLEVMVTDTGPGIPTEALPHIFDRFRQAETDTARRYGGSGLGLAICRRLVTAMGGTIGAESTPGQGSRFTFRIPFRPGAAPPARRSGALRILVGEDVAASRLLLTAVLERAGHEVTAVEDGARALAAMHGASFDLVLMDLHMPGLDGYGVAAAIRTLPGEASRMPLVALTADAPEEVERLCREAGFDAVLRKPFETRRLLGLIESLRRRPEAVREASQLDAH